MVLDPNIGRQNCGSRPTSAENDVIVFIKDTRLTHRAVYEHQALGTIESAKTSAVIQADDDLTSLGEPHEHLAQWRCS
jgi:hypothetical protein